MARDVITLRPVPAAESCAHVGDTGYAEIAFLQCRRYIALLRLAIGPEPEGARLRIRRSDIDFDPYIDVVVQYDDQNPAALDYARRCERDAPTRWPETETPATSPYHEETVNFVVSHRPSMSPALRESEPLEEGVVMTLPIDIYGRAGGSRVLARVATSGIYLLRGLPRDLQRAARVRALSEGTTLRSVLLQGLREYAAGTWTPQPDVALPSSAERCEQVASRDSSL